MVAPLVALGAALAAVAATVMALIPDSIEKISKEEWFYERVFDIYLWNKGG